MEYLLYFVFPTIYSAYPISSNVVILMLLFSPSIRLMVSPKRSTKEASSVNDGSYGCL